MQQDQWPEIYTQEDLLAFCETLPCYGTVSKVSEAKGDYHFIQLASEWQRASSFLVDAAKSLYQYDKKIQASIHELRKKIKPSVEESYFACPTKVGLHISIGKHTVGERIEFKIEKMMTYENQTMERPNQFDKTKYVARWIAVRVNLLTQVEQVSSTHVSIAAVGFSASVNK